MRLLCVVLTCGLVGCFEPRIGPTTCENGLCPPGFGCFDGVCLDEAPDSPDASVSTPDAAPDGPPLCLSFTPYHFDACAIPEPSAPIDLSGDIFFYDTTTGVLGDLQGNQIAHASTVIDGVRLMSVESFSISGNASLRAFGDIPLLIASWSDITVAGDIDVSDAGAGSDDPCSGRGPSSGQNNATGASGGGGGGFGSDGGRGGDSDFNNIVTTGGAGGQSLPSAPTSVRGGCDGSSGGNGDPGSDGRGGNSGGAIQLTARLSITVTGEIDGSGEGGSRGVTVDGGGGGGGSGGYVGLDAPNIALTSATLTCNGGGGGEGADDVTSGINGEDGHRNMIVADGGSGGAADGGDGGDGGVGAVPGQAAGGMPAGGGGGGGGGVGFIVYHGTLDSTGSLLSPAIVELPAP